MNKKELIDFVASTNDMTKKYAGEVVDGILNRIASELEDGGSVEIAGFGKFVVATRAARTSRNPHTGDPVEVPEKRAAKFKPAKQLTDKLNEK